MSVLRVIWYSPRYALLLLVWAYQLLVSPLIGPCCRYHPSCSAYAVTALRRHGLIAGTLLTGWRLLRCNPFTRGGVDDVPDRFWPRWRAIAELRLRGASAAPGPSCISSGPVEPDLARPGQPRAADTGVARHQTCAHHGHAA